MATNSTTPNLFIYRLTFGDIIAFKGKQPSTLQLEQGVRRDFSDGEESYHVLLRGIKINRKIYQPTEIEAELDIMLATTDTSSEVTSSVPKFSDVRDLFLQRLVTVDVLEVTRIRDTVRTVDYKDPINIAKNCYVYEMIPQLKCDGKNKKMYVKLNIFSLDKLMTLNKYSKAYVARKLGSEILQPESLMFGVLSGDVKNGVPLIDTDVSHLQHLMYKDGDALKEFIQPYLVQYNESFYDFLVRTSNRCGEFLYFENGKLILGLPNDDPLINIETFDSVTTQELSIDPLKISVYARDSVKSSGVEQGLNQSVIAKQDTGYPADAFPTNISSNAEFASDDYMFPLVKDKFSNLARELFYDGNGHEIAMAHLLPFFKSMLANETPGVVASIAGSLAKALIVGEGIQAGLAYLQVGTANGNGNKAYIEPYQNKQEQNKEGKTVVHFAALPKNGGDIQSAWTTLDYYNKIHKKETSQQRQIVCINMSTSFIDVKLGQKITIDGMDGTYIVIQIKQNSEEAWSRDYDKYDSDVNDKYTGKRSLKIYAIPAFKESSSDKESASEKDSAPEEYFPPVQPVPIIRKADAQIAFVADNEDPKYQGRVRIAFSWQSMGGAEREELAKVSENLQALEIDIAGLEDKKQKLLNRKIKIQGLIEQLKKYVNSSKDERETILRDKKTKLENLEADLSNQEADRDESSNQLTALNQKVDLTSDDEMNKALLQEKISICENAIKDKKADIDEIEDEISAFEDAAKEHDKKKGLATYQDLEKDNTVIKRYRTDFYDAELLWREADADKKRAEAEKKKSDVKREQLKAHIDKEIKDMSTPWVRVVSPMATPGGGTFFRPRVGDEVLVNFENGNVERPYVMGSLYSKNVLTPDEGLYRKSAPELQWKNISMSMMSPNGHHITFTDPPGGGSFISNLISPGVGFYASVIPGLSTLNGKGKNFKALNGGIHIGDRYGLYEIEMKSHKRSIDIKSPFGTVNINAFSGISISAPNGDVKIKGKNITLEAGNKITMLSGKNIQDPPIEDPEGKWRKASYKIVDILGSVLSEGVAPQFIESVVDFSYIRHVVETFVRPIDGTMLLKSKRYLRIEAGKGNATIKRDRYVDKLTTKKATSEEFYKALVTAVNDISTVVPNYFKTLSSQWENGYTKRAFYMVRTEDLKNPEHDVDVIDMAQKAEKWKSDLVKVEDFKGKFISLAGAMSYLFGEGEQKDDEFYGSENDVLADFKQAADALGEAAIGIKETVKNVEKLLDNITDYTFDGVSMRKIAQDTLKDFTTDVVKNWMEKYFKKDELFKENTINGCQSLMNMTEKVFKRKLILCFIYNVAHSEANTGNKYIKIEYKYDKIKNNKDYEEEHYWKRQVVNMDHYIQKYKFLRMLMENTVNKFTDKLKSNFVPFDKEMWGDKQEGQILFSENESSTLNFNGTQLHEESDANIGTMDYLKKVLLAIK